jgi:alanine dehydrogenase
MIIGVPMEIKSNENRVALTPGGALEFKKRGHQVFIQKGAGLGSGFSDAEYKSAGATILPSIEAIYAKAEMIMKVKEPIASEYKLIKKGQLLFTYFHFASSRELTDAMIENGSVCLAYETVETYDRQLPLLIPMSEVAGRMAIQEGAKYLEKPMGGRGVLLGGVPSVPAGKVLVIGGGIVGTQAAKMAAGLGAQVTILDVNLPRLRYLSDVMPPNVTTMYSSEYNIRQLIQTHDLVVGAVLIPGAKAPKLITKDMLKTMRPGTVIVDVAVDQGGCFETTKATTHDKPIYEVNGVIHYCVANMPGAVPYTSTVALTNATLPYALQLAQKGWEKACRDSRDLRLGLNVVHGKVVYAGVAQAFRLPLVPVEQVLNMNAPAGDTAPVAEKKSAGRPAASPAASAPKAAEKPTGKRGRPAANAKTDTDEPKKKMGRPAGTAKVVAAPVADKPAAKRGPKPKASEATISDAGSAAMEAPKKKMGRPAGTAKAAKPVVEKVAGKRGPKPKAVTVATLADGAMTGTAIPKKSAGRPAAAKETKPTTDQPTGKRGRPAGSPNKEKAEAAPAKKQGRPKLKLVPIDKDGNELVPQPKKKAGRPAGAKNLKSGAAAKAKKPAAAKGNKVSDTPNTDGNIKKKAGRPKKK